MVNVFKTINDQNQNIFYRMLVWFNFKESIVYIVLNVMQINIGTIGENQFSNKQR